MSSAKVITFAIQKGGCTKTTSAACTAWLLAEKQKVLMVDLDAQGNLTEIITKKPLRWWRQNADTNVMAAIKCGDPRPSIVEVNENLHLLPGSSEIGTLSRWLYTEYHEDNKVNLVSRMLDVIDSYYDWVIIDTPPALGDIMLNAIAASDGVIAMYKTGQFEYSALPEFFETIEVVRKNFNSALQTIGILPVLIDLRRSCNKAFLQIIHNKYQQLVFPQVIKNNAATERLAYTGFVDNHELSKVLAQYKPIVNEMVKRVNTAAISVGGFFWFTISIICGIIVIKTEENHTLASQANRCGS